MQKFIIRFSDNTTIQFEDIISLNSIQKVDILSKAMQHPMEQLTNEKTGFKIELESCQKETILNEKDKVISGRTAYDLYNQQIISFTAHAIDRIIKRYKNNPIALLCILQ